MTIEEIKEWRHQKWTSTNFVPFEIIDTLLAEVEQWKDEYQKVNVVRNEQDTKLTIATEALERIAEYKDQNNERECPYIARTALERIKG